MLVTLPSAQSEVIYLCLKYFFFWKTMGDKCFDGFYHNIQWGHEQEKGQTKSNM